VIRDNGVLKMERDAAREKLRVVEVLYICLHTDMDLKREIAAESSRRLCHARTSKGKYEA
jgi:hypothetical protein